MRIAVCSDEFYPVAGFVARRLVQVGHEVRRFGALATGGESPFASTAEEAALSIQQGQCHEGVFFCWSGTGICMAANKIFGIRAALCGDAETAKAARIWNDANVLCLANRSLAEDVAREVLDAWLSTRCSSEGAEGASLLKQLDERYRS